MPPHFRIRKAGHASSQAKELQQQIGPFLAVRSRCPREFMIQNPFNTKYLWHQSNSLALGQDQSAFLLLQQNGG